MKVLDFDKEERALAHTLDANSVNNYASQMINNEEETHPLITNDLKGTKAYHTVNIPIFYTLAMAIVGYKGHRVVAQSIILVIFLSFKQYDLRILYKRITCTVINTRDKSCKEFSSGSP